MEDLKSKISQLLIDTLNYAYCDNCGKGERKESCDCYRKYQEWELASHTANTLAEKILVMIGK